MFVKYECGCVGFEPCATGSAIIVQWCDVYQDEPDTGFTHRNMSGKEFEAVPDVMTSELIAMVGNLCRDGHKLRSVRSLLGVQS